MMAQYRSIRRELPEDTILFFRLGDFYEMFFDDAKTASAILDITEVDVINSGIRRCEEYAGVCVMGDSPERPVFVVIVQRKLFTGCVSNHEHGI